MLFLKVLFETMGHFGNTYAAAHAMVQGRQRVADVHGLQELLDSAWEKAIQRLQLALIRATVNIRDEGLRRQIEVWPSTFGYHIHPENGSVLIYTDSQYLERALFYGTRELPAVKPLQLLVAYLHETIALSEIVFTCRDFHHEPQAKVAPSHT